MWRYYLDQVETSQATGGLHFNLQQFGIIFENDLFGGTKGFLDKFRTGAMGITYQVDSLQLILQTTHWTGKAFDGPKVYDSLYPGKYGYRDLSNVKYDKYSHGILSLGINYPMIQSDGTPYTFREGELIQQPRFYLQAGANPFMF